ncbi:MAG: 5-formyltetrahydrofolate cyclo-ligase [Sedimentisphaerales bacterium]|nr:5-formyltetrahydrofolate cyclo-ligase [Sedimentisphaerales bacterium]
MDKKQLRLELQKLLTDMTDRQRSQKSRSACKNLISTPQFRSASAVMLYMSLPYEVDTSEAILQAWQQGKVVAVPKISWQQRHMLPVRISSLESGFSSEVGGVKNPVTGGPVPFEEIDLVVTPALGFDRKGNRLGRGGSFYDNFFANEQLTAQRCGLGFCEQLIDNIPVAEHDEPVDFLVTDKEIVYFNNRQG